MSSTEIPHRDHGLARSYYGTLTGHDVHMSGKSRKIRQGIRLSRGVRISGKSRKLRQGVRISGSDRNRRPSRREHRLRTSAGARPQNPVQAP